MLSVVSYNYNVFPHLLIFNYQVNDILFDLYQMYIVLTFDSLFIVYVLTLCIN